MKAFPVTVIGREEKMEISDVAQGRRVGGNT